MKEEDLIRGCVKEDRVSQKELYKRFAGKMMAVCLRYSNSSMDAEDILQDGFIKVFDNISKFKMEGSLEGWVRRIMVNTAINKIRANKIKFEDFGQKRLNLIIKLCKVNFQVNLVQYNLKIKMI